MTKTLHEKLGIRIAFGGECGGGAEGEVVIQALEMQLQISRQTSAEASAPSLGALSAR